MLRRIIFCLCLMGMVQAGLPIQAEASQTVITLTGGIDHLPQHVQNQLFRVAGDYYRMSYQDARSAYLKAELIMFETLGPNGERAVMMDIDGNCLLSVIIDIL